MALPVILVNSATGSDTAASGAGPATALTGTSASTSGTGLVVTLDGSPDLSGVATDGSHVLYLADTTAGARNFGKIIAKDDGANTVTVSDAFGLNLTGKSWAIGGKRASIASTTSKKLFDNNSATGDAKAGWTIEMESGHTETIAATITAYGGGDSSIGPITLRGAGAVRPVLTFTNNGTAFSSSSGSLRRWEYFELQNTHGTKTASYGWLLGVSSINNMWRRVKIGHATNKFYIGLRTGNEGCYLEECEICYCGDDGILADGSGNVNIYNSYLHHNGNRGLGMTAGILHTSDSLYAFNTQSGLYQQTSGATNYVERCVFHGNGASGYHKYYAWNYARFTNCIFSSNGGYGINDTSANANEAQYRSFMILFLNCCFYGNTSGATATAALANTLTPIVVNPAFADPANGNFTIGAALRSVGYPANNIAGSATHSYIDVGAAQRIEAYPSYVTNKAKLELLSGLSKLG